MKRKLDPRQAFTVRVDPALYRKMLARAKSEGRSLTMQVERDLKKVYSRIKV